MEEGGKGKRAGRALKGERGEGGLHVYPLHKALTNVRIKAKQ